jgi:hypothetical protein
MTSKERKRTSRNTKKWKLKTQIYLIRLESVFEKKTMVKSVIYLLFSYQTGYIMWRVFHNAQWYWSDNVCKLVSDQWRASLGGRDSESCWFTEKIGTYMRCRFIEFIYWWEYYIIFVMQTIIGSYIRSWERPGDLPRVI